MYVQTKAPLNRPSLDFSARDILDRYEGPCAQEWRDLEKFQEGFSVIKPYIEKKYKGVTLSISSTPTEIEQNNFVLSNGIWEYKGVFRNLELSWPSITPWESRTNEIIREIIRIFRVIGIELETISEPIQNYYTTGDYSIDDEYVRIINNCKLNIGITSHVIKKHSKEYYRLREKNLIRENESSTKKQNSWMKNILSRILGE